MYAEPSPSRIFMAKGIIHFGRATSGIHGWFLSQVCAMPLQSLFEALSYTLEWFETCP